MSNRDRPRVRRYQQNYTTTIHFSKTLVEIQETLRLSGAKGIAVEYNDEMLPIGIKFLAKSQYGLMQFQVPINPMKVLERMKKQNLPNRYLTKEHAYNVAWRMLKELIESQMNYIQSEMIDLQQMMFPFITDGRTTIYERFKENKFEGMVMLNEGEKE
jgi:hypothetical protein